jgi:hypothetical protein
MEVSHGLEFGAVSHKPADIRLVHFCAVKGIHFCLSSLWKRFVAFACQSFQRNSRTFLKLTTGAPLRESVPCVQNCNGLQVSINVPRLRGAKLPARQDLAAVAMSSEDEAQQLQVLNSVCYSDSN